MRTIWLTLTVSCDGGRIGKTWCCEAFTTEELATQKRIEWQARKVKDFGGRANISWQPYELDGIHGEICWYAGLFVYVRSLQVKDSI